MTPTSTASPIPSRDPDVSDILRVGNPTLYALFDRSTDPILLFDPATATFLDANPSALGLLRCPAKSALHQLRPVEWPALPRDRTPLCGAGQVLSGDPEAEGGTGPRFEWTARALDGREIPLEVVATPIRIVGRSLQVMVARDISERKRDEAALRESQALLASIADNISQAIYRSDAGHRLIFVNRAYLEMFGYASLEELQDVPREVLYARPADRPPLLELLRREGAFSQQEVEYVRKDGRRFWGLASARIVRDPRSGRVDYHVGAIADITERRRAAEEIRHLNATLERRITERTAELAASEVQLRTIVEHAPEAIVVYDAADGTFISCNQNAVRLFGLPPDALCSLTPVDVSPLTQPDGRPSADGALDYIQEALQGGTPVFEWTHRHADGHPIPCEVRLVRLPVEGRNLLRASITDNTERHRRELIQQATYQISEAVPTANDLGSLYQRIHEIVRGLMPASNFYIALSDPQTGMIHFPYYQDEHDPDLDRAPRRPDTGLTSAVLRTGQSLLVDEAMNARKRRVGDAVTFEGHEHIRYIESGHPAANWLGVPLKLQGKTVGVMAVQDYHNPYAYGDEERQILNFVANQTALAIERKRAENDLRRALQREVELGQMKTTFISMVSHEFRTPLGIIMSSAGILEKYFDRLEPAERANHLASIQRSTRRMGDLMEEVLLLSRLDAGRVGCEHAPLDLAGFLRILTDEVLSVTAHRCPIRLHLELPSRPASADENLLRHIFTNLLTNAVKYSEPGSPIEFDAHLDGVDAVCRVCDHGIGIPAEDREWLFHAFHRGRNVGQRSGTGLGLVIVQRCLEIHGGRIEVSCPPEGGTIMTVSLPIYRADDSDPLQPADPR